MNTQIVLRLANRSDADLTLVLEPWADEYSFPSGALFRIVGYAATPGEFEVEYAVERITVYAWPGATIRIFDGNREFGVGNGPREPAPPTPAV